MQYSLETTDDIFLNQVRHNSERHTVTVVFLYHADARMHAYDMLGFQHHWSVILYEMYLPPNTCKYLTLTLVNLHMSFNSKIVIFFQREKYHKKSKGFSETNLYIYTYMQLCEVIKEVAQVLLVVSIAHKYLPHPTPLLQA